MKRRICSSTIWHWFGLWALLFPACLGSIIVAQANLTAPASPATSEKPVLAPGTPLQLSGRPPLHLFTEAHGLPQNTIEAVAFDQQGYLWAGSQNGIARFNGHLWQRIPLEGTQSGSWIHDILSASDGSLWFARQGGISCLRTEGWKHFDQQTGFPDISAWRLLESVKPDGTPVVWCGTFKTGLFRIEHDRMTQVEIPSPIPPLKTIQCLFETREADSSRKLWFGTELGALSYDGQNWKLYTLADGLPNQAVRAVFETSLFSGKPELVACCGPYLARFDGTCWQQLTKVPPLPTPSVSMTIEAKAADGSRSLWFGMHGNGLLRLQSSSDGFVWTSFTEATGFPNDQVWCVRAMAGKEGTRSLWAGTSGGLVRLDPYQWQTIDSRTGLSHNNVWCIQPAPAATGVPALWVGTLKGLTCFSANRETGLPTVQVYDTRSGLPNDQVWCLLETTALTGQKTLVAGTGQGLARFENGRWIPAPLPIQGKFQPVIWSLNETKADDGSPVLWVGTSLSGVWRWSLNHWEHFSKSSGNFPSDWIYDIVETTDRQGNHTVWFATFEGLVQWQNGTSRLYDLKAGLPSSSLWGLHVSQTQNGTFLWVAGNQGVGRANLAETPLTWTVFSTKTKPALPDNDVYRIAEDLQGRLYLTTNHGIARLTPRLPTAENPALYHINTFTTEDGLPYNECNQGALTIDEQGQVWAGTTKGLAHFSVAQEVTDNPPRLVLEQATAGMRHPIPVKAQTELSASQNLLHFTYALLQYSHGAETMYQTQLVGMEETPSEWSHDTKIRYTNLAAGSYSFCVWGRDASGNITGPTTLSFHVKPAWWRTWWAYGCYLVGVAGVGYGLVRVRVRRLERQNLLLESKVTERTSQLAEKNEQLDKKIAELARKNQELIESHKRAEFIFSALAEVLPGTVLDSKYRLDAKIGAGGFGAVFRATHLSLNRSVAVKVFRPASGNDSKEALERFRFEGVTACRVNHPNAVQVLDSGVSNEGIAYLVMELLQGRSLAGVLQEKQRLSLVRCLQILDPLCAVLAEAHAQGIIHRDIKPDNVFLHQSPEGEVVKVVDFGIAKLLHDTDSGEFQNLTITGGIVGTPLYMAPERLSQEVYDGQSDVYSVGVMLYQMLLGRLPFSVEGNNLYALMFKHIRETPPPLRQFNPDIPPDVEALVLRTLAKQPQDRPTARELAETFAELTAKRMNLASGPELLQRLRQDQGTGLDSSLAETLQVPQITNEVTLLQAPATSGAPHVATPAEQAEATISYAADLTAEPTLHPQEPAPTEENQ